MTAMTAILTPGQMHGDNIRFSSQLLMCFLAYSLLVVDHHCGVLEAAKYTLI